MEGQCAWGFTLGTLTTLVKHWPSQRDKGSYIPLGRDVSHIYIYHMNEAHSVIIHSTYYYQIRGYNHGKNVDDKELSEQLILDDQQNGLHDQRNEQDWRQDRDNPIRVPTGTSDNKAICASISAMTIT